MQVLIKSLLTLYLLMSHWPKQVLWPGPVSVWEGLHKGSEYWEVWFIGGHRCTNLPQSQFTSPVSRLAETWNSLAAESMSKPPGKSLQTACFNYLFPNVMTKATNILLFSLIFVAMYSDRSQERLLICISPCLGPCRDDSLLRAG